MFTQENELENAVDNTVVILSQCQCVKIDDTTQ